MTEMEIANSLVLRVQNELQRHPRHRATRIGLRLGEQAGLDGESLKSCFEAVAKGADLPPVALEIEWTNSGEHCVNEFHLSYFEFEEEAVP